MSHNADPNKALGIPQWHAYEVQQLLRELTERQGVSQSVLLEGTGITETDLANPSLLLSLEQELKLYVRIANNNRDPQLALRQGKQMGINHCGILGQAMLSANTLRDALQLVTKYAPLISWASHMSLGAESFQGESMVCLTLQPTPVDSCTAQFEVEGIFATLFVIFHQIVAAKVQFEAVFIGFPCQLADESVYTDFFQCPVYFQAGQNKLLFSRTTVSRRLPYAEPEYAELFNELCGKRVQALKQKRGLVPALRGFVETYEQGVPSIDEVASYFNISSRTLHRRLRELGASYKAIIDDVRFVRARQLLSSTSLTVEAVARTLGYSDVRSFRAAFKKWAGLTPSEYRSGTDADGQSEKTPDGFGR